AAGESACRPKLDVIAECIARVTKVGRHDADDCVRVFIHANRPPDDMRIRSELPFPEAVADHDAIQTAGHPLRLRVSPSECGRRSEELEVVRARPEKLDPLHAVAA